MISKMKLIDDWHWVIRKAWSIRLAVVAAIFSGAEVIVPMLQTAMPHGIFAILSFVAVAGGFISRFVVQDRG